MGKGNKMENVYIFVPYMTGYGGTETVIQNLFKEYSKSSYQGYKFNLISIGGFKNGEWISGVQEKKIIKLSPHKAMRKLQYLLFLPFIIFKLVRNNKKMNVAISTNPVMWTLLYIYKNVFRYDYEVVSWFHYSIKAKKISSFFLKQADKYFAISTGIAKQLKNIGIDDKKIKTVFNPVMKNDKCIRRSDNNKKIFLYIGRIMLDGQKNMRLMLRALASVHGEWQLIIFGEGEIEEVKEYAKSLKILKKISFRGFKSDPWQEVEIADFLLLSSKYEGFPMVLNESISMGLPVLATNCETGPEDIVNENNGILVRDNSLNDFKIELQNIIDDKYTFNDICKIKESIKAYYSENYYDMFIKSL